MKILFNKKQEVNIGDLIKINGIEVEVTQQVIDNNPRYFEFAKEKTLEDYENILLNDSNLDSFPITINDDKGYYTHVERKDVYKILKSHEPKLYWLKTLQLIANDLNGDWKPDWRNNIQIKWVFKLQYGVLKVDYWHTANYGIVAFKSKELAEKLLK